jgi:predicted transcriptional regulator
MATLTELTAEIVSAHASGSSITSEELLKNIHAVYNTLKFLDAGETSVSSVESAPTETPVMTVKQAFKNKDEVLCMICGKGFKTLKRHLTKAHELKPAEYRKQFGIPSTQTLAAKSYVDSRKQMAIDMGLGAGLVKFRADKKAATEAKNAGYPVAKAKKSLPAQKVKTGHPAVKAKATVPAMKTKAPLTATMAKTPVPPVKKKPALPAKVKAVPAPAKTKKATAVTPTPKTRK